MSYNYSFDDGDTRTALEQVICSTEPYLLSEERAAQERDYGQHVPLVETDPFEVYIFGLKAHVYHNWDQPCCECKETKALKAFATPYFATEDGMSICSSCLYWRLENGG